MSRLTPEQVRRRLDRGLVPAVPVPFTAMTEIDLDAQARYVGYMRGQPVAGVAVWAHTGRGLHLSRAQRLQVLRAWSEGLNPRSRAADKIVVAGIGGAPVAGYDLKAFVNSALEMAGIFIAAATVFQVGYLVGLGGRQLIPQAQGEVRAAVPGGSRRRWRRTA